eukprot:8683781-Pyramimonas_sp.AAC.1
MQPLAERVLLGCAPLVVGREIKPCGLVGLDPLQPQHQESILQQANVIRLSGADRLDKLQDLVAQAQHCLAPIATHTHTHKRRAPDTSCTRPVAQVLATLAGHRAG